MLKITKASVLVISIFSSHSCFKSDPQTSTKNEQPFTEQEGGNPNEKTPENQSQSQVLNNEKIGKIKIIDEGYRLETYSVSGNSVREIRDFLENSPDRPVDSNDNSRNDALSLREFHYKYDYKKTCINRETCINDDCPAECEVVACDVTNLSITISASLTLPNLSNINSVCPYVRETWRQYYQALLSHEEKHVSFGQIMVDSFIGKVKDEYVQQSDCNQIDQDFERWFTEARAQAVAQDVSYDKETTHGILEGACFGPDCDQYDEDKDMACLEPVANSSGDLYVDGNMECYKKVNLNDGCRGGETGKPGFTDMGDRCCRLQ